MRGKPEEEQKLDDLMKKGRGGLDRRFEEEEAIANYEKRKRGHWSHCTQEAEKFKMGKKILDILRSCLVKSVGRGESPEMKGRIAGFVAHSTKKNVLRV